MKISVSLNADDVQFLDAYAGDHGCGSRSGAVAAAVRALREAQLVKDYERAFTDWAQSGEQQAWETVVADGLPTEDRS